MNSSISYLLQLSKIAKQNRHRYGVVVNGEDIWQQSLVQSVIDSYRADNTFQIGGSAFNGITQVAMKKGQGLLGRECQLLICDCREGFDANGFSAALGALVGGGVLLILPPKMSSDSIEADQHWLHSHFNKLYQIIQNQAAPELPDLEVVRDKESDILEQQKQAVSLIHKVVTGHRKRPLVVTADRGRGKSSALGIAAAELLQQKPYRILITASSSKSIAPVFEHANNLLPDSEFVSANHLRYQAGELKFVAPDELLREAYSCDLLLVDEAASIPLPMLKSMVERYHRAVFSTTVHGYEGSGRGFGIKFQTWLSEQRPGWKAFQIEQPIRWASGDPLEAWLFDAFLLNSEIDEELNAASVSEGSLTWRVLERTDYLQSPELLKQCFALLVNAHYQTSPNDLMQLLANPDMKLHVLLSQQTCIGCVLSVAEGNLESGLIQDIQLGKRRPRGHLVPALLANHIGISEAAEQSCLRIMRIAVHPNLQRTGIGSDMIKRVRQSATQYDYLATSFGATSDLVTFWTNNGFSSLHLGHQRDQASGCHSLVMVDALSEQAQLWCEAAGHEFTDSFQYLLSSSLATLETEMVRALLLAHPHLALKPNHRLLLENYASGGNSFDSIAYMLERLILSLKQNQREWVSDLLIKKVIQKQPWHDCIHHFQLSGRKQTEQKLRQDITYLLHNLHCK